MKVYLDLVFILNFLFDFILLIVVGTILRRNASMKRMLFASSVGALSVFTLFLSISSFTLFVIKVVISIVMVLISFGFKTVKYTLRNLFYLYSSSLILGGFLYFLNVTFSYQQKGLVFYHDGLSINFMVLVIFSPIILYAYINQSLHLKNHYANYYQVDIYFKNGVKKTVSAYLDTGNHLVDPYMKRPIILVNKKEIRDLYSENDITLVPFDTLNNHGLLKCVVPLKIYIVGIGFKEKVLIGISDEPIHIDGIDCLLHTKLLEG